jgi:hypothetical protein
MKTPLWLPNIRLRQLVNFVLSMFFPNVVAMANGRVLITGQEQGVDSDNILDAGEFLYEWDSTANNFALMNPPAQGATFAVDSLARSADHKWAVFSADQFYLYSSDRNNLRAVSLSTANPPQNQFGVRGYAINSDGSKIAVASATQVTFLDNSLTSIGSTILPGAFQTARTAVQFSPDDTKLFLQYPFPIVLEVVDANNYTALGYFSALVNPENNEERMLAINPTGRAFVGIAGGVRSVDLTKSPAPNSPDGNFSGPNCEFPPSTLPLNTSTQVQISAPYTTANVYVNGQPAPFLPGRTTVVVPASSTPALVDVQCIDSGGNETVMADPSPTVVPATNLLQLIYDTHRSLLYALKTTEVDVLNPATLQWQSTFTRLLLRTAHGWS